MGHLFHGRNSLSGPRKIMDLSEKVGQKVGWVYLIHARETPYYKIGASRDVEHRLHNLQSASPFALEVEHAVASSQPGRLEAALHAAFASRRVRGEWFE